MKDFKVGIFYVITFAVCWLIAATFFLLPETMEAVFGPMSLTNPVYILYAWMPTLVALGMSAAIGGRKGIRELLDRCTHWKTGAVWYVLIFLGIPTLGYLAALLSGLPVQGAAKPLIGMILPMILIGPLSEEPGWRGYALPGLLKHGTALRAGLITGFLWAVWHLPAYIIAGTPQESTSPVQAFLGFFLIAIGMNLLQAWVFVGTKASALLAGILFHLAYNISMTLFNDPHFWMGVLFMLAAIVVYAAPGNRYLIKSLKPISM